jgi:hypothetical protein
MYNDYANDAWAKNSSFVNFGLQGWLAAVCKCAVCAVGFLFLCAGAEKNKINSHQLSTYLSSKSLVLFSCLFIQRVKISKLKFRSDTLAYNVSKIYAVADLREPVPSACFCCLCG